MSSLRWIEGRGNRHHRHAPFFKPQRPAQLSRLFHHRRNILRCHFDEIQQQNISGQSHGIRCGIGMHAMGPDRKIDFREDLRPVRHIETMIFFGENKRLLGHSDLLCLEGMDRWPINQQSELGRGFQATSAT